MKRLILTLLILLMASPVWALSDKLEIYDSFPFKFYAAKTQANQQAHAYAIQSDSRMRQLSSDFTVHDWTAFQNLFSYAAPDGSTYSNPTTRVYPTTTEGMIFIEGVSSFNHKYLYKSIDRGEHFGNNAPNYNDGDPVLYLGADPTDPTNITKQSTKRSSILPQAFCEATIGGVKTFLIGEYPAGALDEVDATGFNRVTIWKSTDNGDTWSSVVSWPNTTTLVTNHVHAIVQNPYDPNKIYISLGDSKKDGIWHGGVIVWNGTDALNARPDADAGWKTYLQDWSPLDFMCRPDGYVYTGPEGPNVMSSDGLWRFDSSLSLGSKTKVYDSANSFDDARHGFGPGCVMPDGTLIITRICGTEQNTSNHKTAIIASIDDGATWKPVGYYTYDMRDLAYMDAVFPFGGKLVMSGDSAAGKEPYVTTVVDVSGLIKNGETPKIIHPVYYVNDVTGSDTINLNYNASLGDYNYATKTNGHQINYGSKTKPWATLQYALGDAGNTTVRSEVDPSVDSRVCNGSRILVTKSDNIIDLASTATIIPCIDNFKVGGVPGASQSGPVIIEGAKSAPLEIKNTNASWSSNTLFDCKTRKETANWSSSTTYAINAYVKYGDVLWKSKRNNNLNHAPTAKSSWWTDSGGVGNTFGPDGLGFVNCVLTNAKAGGTTSLMTTTVSDAVTGYAGSFLFDKCVLGSPSVSHGSPCISNTTDYGQPRITVKNSLVTTGGAFIGANNTKNIYNEVMIDNTVFIGGVNAILADFYPLDGGTATKSWIRNCTFINYTTAAITIPAGSSFFPEIKNCIFSSAVNTHAICDQAGLTETNIIDYNCIYGGTVYTSIGGTANAHSTTEDPKLHGVGWINTDSSAYHTGTPINSPVWGVDKTDISYNATTPSMGAYEYDASRAIYVDSTNGSDYFDGSVSAEPYKTIAKANAATYLQGDDSIKLKCDETWTEMCTISTSGTSGHALTYTSYGLGAAPIIDGTGNTHAMLGSSKNYITISGIDFRAGTTACLGITGAGNNISNCTAHDGVIGISSDAATVAQCISHGNSGTGIATAGGIVRYCKVYSNGDVGISIGDSDSTVDSNVIHSNTSYGISAATGSATISILGNTLYQDNIHVASGVTVDSILNNIVWAGSDTSVSNAGTITNLNYNDLYTSGDQYDGTVNNTPTGNLNANPKFFDAANGDYHLLPGSPCIDAGIDSNAPDFDIEGTPRPQGAGYDMGALEFNVDADYDYDGIPDTIDNCPNIPNGPSLGTCMPGSDKAGVACHSDADCVLGCSVNGVCSMSQEDTNQNGVGDVCEN